MWFSSTEENTDEPIDYFRVSTLELDNFGYDRLEHLRLRKSSTTEQEEYDIHVAVRDLNLEIEEFNHKWGSRYGNNVEEDQVNEHDELEKRKSELKSWWMQLKQKKIEDESRNIQEERQNQYYNQHKIHFDIKDELHTLNTKMDTLISLFRQDIDLSKTGQKSSKRTRSSTKKYGLSRKQSSAMRIALKKARQKGYKDYSPAMRKMISSAIHRAK